MSKSRVIVAQPFSDVWTYEHNWQTGLSACVDDCGTCCYAFFCYCCLVRRISTLFVELFMLNKFYTHQFDLKFLFISYSFVSFCFYFS